MEKIKGFKNSNILTEEGLKKTNLIIENGYIYSIGNYDEEGLIELDDQKIVIPGLIDQHIHGAFGSDAIDGKEEAIYKRMLENERLSSEWDNLLTKKKDEDKAFYKDCYRKLVKVVHPDNTEINMDDKTEAMKCLNQLKKQWNF